MKFTKVKALLLIFALVLSFNFGITTAQEAVDVSKLDYHTPQSVQDFENLQAQIIKTVNQVRTSVVCVQIGGGSGSGTFIHEDGWVLTAAHVTRWQANVNCQIVMSDGTKYPAKSMGYNRELDFALVKAEIPKDVKINVSKMGDSDAVKVGRWVISMGHPLGFKVDPVRPPVVRTGRVIQVNKMIVSDAPLISGDSGGPMFDLNGNVLGVNVSISIRDVKGNNTTKVNPVKVQLEALMKGEVTSGTGASISGYDNGITDAYELLEAATKDKDPAGFAKAEEKFQEVIKLDDTNPDGYYHMTCCYSRWMGILEGEAKDAMQKRALDALQLAFEKGWRDLSHMYRDPDMNNLKDTDRYKNLITKYRGGVYFGFTLKEITDEHKKKFELDGGVLVTGVTKDDPADKAGIKVDDIITKMDDKEIKDTIQLKNYMPRLKVGQVVKVFVKREVEGKIETLELSMTLGGVTTATNTSTSFSSMIYKEGSKLREVWKDVVKDSKLYESVVRINTTTGKLLSYGVIVREDGLIITKFSRFALDSAGKFNLMNYPNFIIELSDGRKFAPTQVNESRKFDIALLKINAMGLRPVEWGDSGKYQIGEFVAAFANNEVPIGLGIISLHNYQSNVGGQKVQLGVRIQDTSNLKKFGIDYDKGIAISSVTPGSDAYNAKLKAGDIIVDIDDEGIDTSQKLRDYLAKLEPGRRIWVEVYRSGVEGTFTRVIKLSSPLSSARPVNSRANAIAGPKSRVAEGFGDVIQNDIALRPESTGTLIVDLKGNVLGMEISRVERTRTYALPANILKEVIPTLIEEMRDIPLKEDFKEEKDEELDEEDF